jgi:hypothetical protein
MPPPLRCPSTLPSASCAKQLYKAAQSSRSFSTTSRHDQRITRARRQLFRWLGTQGAAFQNPLPGSTNYLGAYNAQGQLKRVVEAAAEKEKSKEKQRKSEGPGKTFETEGSEKQEKLPRETNRDLVPFPANKAFVSQPVLSEELREEIWSRIMKSGKSVREVSAELGVEMSRVGAVVRLMEIEKEWRRIVSFLHLLSDFGHTQLYDDHIKNRLVLKTNTWLQNLRMRASLKVQFTLHLDIKQTAKHLLISNA